MPLKMPDDRPAQSEGGAASQPSDAGDIQTVLYDFDAQGEDEINLRRGQIVKVLSRDPTVSGDVGWWAGEVVGERTVGIFPSNYVTSVAPGEKEKDSSPREAFAEDDGTQPPKIDISEITKGAFVGSGGFGKVFEGLYKNQKIAIKSIEPRDPSSASNNEASILAEGGFFWQLNHPNIVQLMGICVDPPNYWLIMEFCSGGGLNTVLEKEPKICPNTLLSWASQIATGMEYIHSKNIIHRDLKSWNVLLLEPFDPMTGFPVTLKITDFGLARSSMHSTILSTAGGTYRWMAPENITQSSYSRYSDVWSFGVVLWELLTGETPYKSLDPLAIAYGIGQQSLKLPIPESCPKVFKELLEACWRYDPHQRPPFSEIREMIKSIERSEFRRTPRESFYAIQQEWKVEIDDKIEDLKRKEILLNERERELVAKEKELYAMRLQLQKREDEVFRKELCETFNKPPPEQPRRFRGRSRPIEISSPTDFEHKFTWSSSGTTMPSSGRGKPITLVPESNKDCFKAQPVSGSHKLHVAHDSQSPNGEPRTAHSPNPRSNGAHLNVGSSYVNSFSRSPMTPRRSTQGSSFRGRTRSSSANGLTTARSPCDLMGQRNESFEREYDEGRLIVNPMTHQPDDQSLLHEEIKSPAKEHRKKSSFIGQSIKQLYSFLQKLPGANAKESRRSALNSHSRSYDELGLGEHMQEDPPRSLDNSQNGGPGTPGRYQHNTYHGDPMKRVSGTRPPLFNGNPLWDAHHTDRAMYNHDSTPRRRSSTASHDSDQAYNSGASSILGPSPIGHAAIISTPQQTSDYPYTPSSAELASAETLCNIHSTPSSYDLPPRGGTISHHPGAIISPSSSHGSSVFDNPGARPRSPPRTPQLFAKNMVTPNANAYRLHSSPRTPRRGYTVTDALPRPSTLNIQQRTQQIATYQNSPSYDLDQSSPECHLSPRFPTVAGSRRGVHLSTVDYPTVVDPHGWNERTQTPSPAPSSPIKSNIMYAKDPTIDSLEDSFGIRF